jgi:FkbM family methyltransferase
LLERAIFPPEAEDAARLAFFGASPGFFVEVGANEPIVLSQTHTLELAGWSGILIEPLPIQAALLRSQRTAQVFEFACSSPDVAGRAVPFFVAGIYSSLKAELPTVGIQSTETISVETRELDQILIEAKAPVPIDFLSIDVEGAEIDVLKGFSFEKWKPRLLVVEDRAIDFALHRYIQKKGYRWVKRFALNNWYVPRDSPVKVSPIGRLQFFRKYYLGLHLRRYRRAAARKGIA